MLEWIVISDCLLGIMLGWILIRVWSLGIMVRWMVISDCLLGIILGWMVIMDWSLGIMVINNWLIGTVAVIDWSIGNNRDQWMVIGIGSCKHNSVRIYTLVVSQLNRLSQFVWPAAVMGELESSSEGELLTTDQKVAKLLNCQRGLKSKQFLAGHQVDNNDAK